EERVITGTWCTPEIQMAVKKGYNILKIYEVYHFEQSSQYDPLTGAGGLFAEYVNTFLKIKQEASGFPSDCDSEELKREYIRQYKENEGIDLEYEKIQKNPGLRCLAKLCLNSFWGKFGQRLSMKQSKFFHESEFDKFFQILSDPTKIPHNFHIISRDTLQFEWSNHLLFMPSDCKTNIFLASFTTAHARLRLFSVLDRLGESVLYFDTDSIIFKTLKSDDLHYLPIGNYLGELTNEIKAEDGYIIEFVSGGPKNYAYRTLSGREECKVRGFTLNWTNSKVINFEAIKSIICISQEKQIEVINPCKISRDSRKRKLLNRTETKRYQMVYTKRRILPNLDTLPFGYC
uniref:DNA-directed DNA polymerase n=1 Tax=Magallana gigas TaxID=29159 RepID=A0A8W8JGF1_MAGGI